MGVREILAGSRTEVKFLFLLVNDFGNAEQTLSCGAGASFWECILYPVRWNAEHLPLWIIGLRFY